MLSRNFCCWRDVSSFPRKNVSIKLRRNNFFRAWNVLTRAIHQKCTRYESLPSTRTRHFTSFFPRIFFVEKTLCWNVTAGAWRIRSEFVKHCKYTLIDLPPTECLGIHFDKRLFKINKTTSYLHQIKTGKNLWKYAPAQKISRSPLPVRNPKGTLCTVGKSNLCRR